MNDSADLFNLWNSSHSSLLCILTDPLSGFLKSTSESTLRIRSLENELESERHEKERYGSSLCSGYVTVINRYLSQIAYSTGWIHEAMFIQIVHEAKGSSGGWGIDDSQHEQQGTVLPIDYRI